MLNVFKVFGLETRNKKKRTTDGQAEVFILISRMTSNVFWCQQDVPL